jgi:hypothetical protein
MRASAGQCGDGTLKLDFEIFRGECFGGTTCPIRTGDLLIHNQAL